MRWMSLLWSRVQGECMLSRSSLRASEASLEQSYLQCLEYTCASVEQRSCGTHVLQCQYTMLLLKCQRTNVACRLYSMQLAKGSSWLSCTAWTVHPSPKVAARIMMYRAAYDNHVHQTQDDACQAEANSTSRGRCKYTYAALRCEGREDVRTPSVGYLKCCMQRHSCHLANHCCLKPSHKAALL